MFRVRSPRKKDRRSVEQSTGNFTVVIRVRPPLRAELSNFENCVEVSSDGRTVVLTDTTVRGSLADTHHIKARHSRDTSSAQHCFSFDRVYSRLDCQQTIYDNTARSAVVSTLQGYNATVLAFGQTASGKTYTMEGFAQEEQKGITPRCIGEIYDYIRSSDSCSLKFLVRASYLQIYNEVISDLLKPERDHLNIREDPKKGVFVEGLSEWVVRTPNEVHELMHRGGAVRAIGSTAFNELSSRSHTLFIVIIEQIESLANGKDNNIKQSLKVGKLNLVDLAGSERVQTSGATGTRLEESKRINQSLLALGNVISALTNTHSRCHIPYRDSKLTRILEDSIGGNCKTTMIAMISPAYSSFNETLATLRFANRAKHVKNRPKLNEDIDEKALLRRYERELKELRIELSARSQSVVDKRKWLELEELKRRAEQERLAAIFDLERLARDLMAEKVEKKRLEEQIHTLSSLLLVGETVNSADDMSAALNQQQESLVHEYEHRLSEMEKERQDIHEDKTKFARVKALLLKQRDIMSKLGNHLKQRDTSIKQLRESNDELHSQLNDAQDTIDKKTALILHLTKSVVQLSIRIGESPPDIVQMREEASFSMPLVSPTHHLNTHLPDVFTAVSPIPCSPSDKFNGNQCNQYIDNGYRQLGNDYHTRCNELETRLKEANNKMSIQVQINAQLDEQVSELKKRNLLLSSGLSEQLEAKESRIQYLEQSMEEYIAETMEKVDTDADARIAKLQKKRQSHLKERKAFQNILGKLYTLSDSLNGPELPDNMQKQVDTINRILQAAILATSHKRTKSHIRASSSKRTAQSPSFASFDSPPCVFSSTPTTLSQFNTYKPPSPLNGAARSPRVHIPLFAHSTATLKEVLPSSFASLPVLDFSLDPISRASM